MDHKTFFRKLDFVLTQISSNKSEHDLLYTIVKELEQVFGDDLHLKNGRIYEEDAGGYHLVNPPESTDGTAAPWLPMTSKAVTNVLKNGVYIFDDPQFSIDTGISRQLEYAIPAAIEVHSPEEKWIFVFELKSGWAREQVELTLNAVRTMLNYRLASDAIEGEIQRAAMIQASLLPAYPPKVEGYDIAGKSVPAEIVGGDLIDYFVFDDDIFGVTLGDASGHGLPAALLVRDVVTGLRMGLEKEMKMAYTIKKLNSVIHRSTFSSGFISLFYGELEKSGNMIYINAGHPPPFLVSGEKTVELKATGMILGALPELSIHRELIHMPAESVLVIFSDGVFEREDSDGELFGLERLKACVIENQHKTAAEILELIFSAAKDFGDSPKWQDDATVVVVKRQNCE